MAKLKLNATMRNTLKNYARDYISAGLTKEDAIIKQHYDIFEPIMLKHVEAKFPKSDMEIVKKYLTNTPYDPFCVKLTAGGFSHFTFETGRAPFVAERSCYLLNEEETCLFTNWSNAVGARKDVLIKKRYDYASLIDAAKYFEDVVAVWPAAEAKRPESANAVLVISPEIIDRIKDDISKRAA